MSVYVPTRLAPLPPAMKAGPIGPGAGQLMTEFPLLSILGQQDPRSKMRKAARYGVEVPWIRAAEGTIDFACSTVDWHLEDEDDTEVDDEYPDAKAQQARALLEKPQGAITLRDPGTGATIGKKLTRRELWTVTHRHMGLCGNAFWFLDQLDVVAGTPAAIIYLAPWRMTPNEDANGNLLSWQLDKTPQQPGIGISLEQVLQFVLDPPDEGHYGIGLVESAIIKLQNSTNLDRYLASVIAAGGKLSGFLGPKAGDHFEEPQFQQVVADARNIVESPNAAARLQVTRGPIEFQATSMSLRDMRLVEMMTLAEDELLGLWRVPKSQIASTAEGMNSGESHKIERQAFWENANHPRIVSFVEPIQFHLLDRWQELGTTIELEIDEPTFTDDGPRFDLLQKAAGTPLRNWERRELINKEPFGPKVVDDMGRVIDDLITLATTEAQVWYAPEDGIGLDAVQTQVQATQAPVVLAPVPPAQLGPGTLPPATAGSVPAVPAAKASLHDTLQGLRKTLAGTVTPKLQASVSEVLREQRREVTQRARGQIAHLMANPKDLRAVWDQPKWDRRLREALAPHLEAMASEVGHGVRAALPSPMKAGKAMAAPDAAVLYILQRSLAGVSDINDTTRQGLLRLILLGVENGDSAAVLGDAIEQFTGWDEARAELIARTEVMQVYNHAALQSYADLGVTQVQAIDGEDFDEICRERDGQVFPIGDADQVFDHPNGTLSWIPVLPVAEPLAEPVAAKSRIAVSKVDGRWLIEEVSA